MQHAGRAADVRVPVAVTRTDHTVYIGVVCSRRACRMRGLSCDQIVAAGLSVLVSLHFVFDASTKEPIFV